MAKFGFISQFLKKENSVGAIAPSSKLLARKIMKRIDFDKVDIIVELGTGTGSITKEILKNLSGNTQLYTFETNERFLKGLKKIEDDRLHVIHDSAENILKHIPEGEGKVDVVLSSLPFTILSSELKDNIMSQVTDSLKSDGVFFQFQYSLQAYRYFKKLFDEVKLDFTAANLPPAFIYTCKSRVS